MIDLDNYLAIIVIIKDQECLESEFTFTIKIRIRVVSFCLLLFELCVHPL